MQFLSFSKVIYKHKKLDLTIKSSLQDYRINQFNLYISNVHILSYKRSITFYLKNEKDNYRIDFNLFIKLKFHMKYNIF